MMGKKSAALEHRELDVDLDQRGVNWVASKWSLFAEMLLIQIIATSIPGFAAQPDDKQVATPDITYTLSRDLSVD